jgi:PadR family transcriptional regulator PadR
MRSPWEVCPFAGSQVTQQAFDYGRAACSSASPKRGRPPDILNNVRQIKPDDYYAPILGEFEHLALLALVRLGNGAYGAAIRRDMRERTCRDVSVGSVYMALGRLEEKKMIASYTGLPTKQRGGRRRKHYLMDKDGERALGRAYRSFAAMAEGIEGALAAM